MNLACSGNQSKHISFPLTALYFLECSCHGRDLFSFLFCSFWFVNQNTVCTETVWNLFSAIFLRFIQLHGSNACLLDCLKACICIFYFSCLIWVLLDVVFSEFWSSALNAPNYIHIVLFLLDKCFYFSCIRGFCQNACCNISLWLKVISLFSAGSCLYMLLK